MKTPHHLFVPLTRIALCLLVLVPAAAWARSVVFPHVLETSGTISTTQYAFDHQFIMTYAGGIAGSPEGSGSATVNLYVYDQSTGQPLLAQGGTPVCAPCTYELGDGPAGPGPRRIVATLDDEIVARGGFASPVAVGFAVADIQGDADNVSITSLVLNAQTGPLDLGALFEIEPQNPGGPGPVSGSPPRAFVLPSVIENSGTIVNNQYAFDMDLYMTYCAGIAGLPAGGGAGVDLYLLDNQGAPIQSGTNQDVCNPCQFALGTDGGGGAAPRKRAVRVDDLIVSAGGFATSVVTGWAILVVSGDADHVNLSSAVTYAKDSPFLLSVFVLEPQLLQAVANVAVEPQQRGAVRALSGRPNPSSGGVELSFALERAARVNLEVFDAQGRRVAALYRGRLEAGSHSLHWDGRDERGRLAPAGLYFGRLAGDDGSQVTRLVKAR